MYAKIFSMVSNRELMIMAGDGIGAEVMAATMNVIEWLAANRSVSFIYRGPCWRGVL